MNIAVLIAFIDTHKLKVSELIEHKMMNITELIAFTDILTLKYQSQRTLHLSFSLNLR